MASVVVGNEVNDLILGVFDHGLARLPRVGIAGTRIEQTQEIVNLSGSAYGGARVLVRGLLLDADDGRKTSYLIDIRALHATKEVASVGRKGLYVAALSLGVDGVESQR